MAINARRVIRFAIVALLTLTCSAFAADPDVSIAIATRGDAFIVDATIIFPVPLRNAWDVLTDFDNMVGVLSNLTQSKIIERTRTTLLVRQEGRARYGLFSYSFTSEREIRLKPMQRIRAQQLSGDAKSFVSEMQLSETVEGTQGRYHAEIVPASGIARTFGGPFIRHEIEEQFTAMSAEMVRRKAR